jgi:hypothetical protein
MANTPTRLHTSAGFELRFQSLFNAGRALVFPCDAQGQVQPEQLPEQARSNFFRALSLIGRDFAVPVKQLVSH